MKRLELDNPNIWWMHPISPILIGENKYDISVVFLFLSSKSRTHKILSTEGISYP
jgi:hypothetical protein